MNLPVSLSWGKIINMKKPVMLKALANQKKAWEGDSWLQFGSSSSNGVICNILQCTEIELQLSIAFQMRSSVGLSTCIIIFRLHCTELCTMPKFSLDKKYSLIFNHQWIPQKCFPLYIPSNIWFATQNTYT